MEHSNQRTKGNSRGESNGYNWIPSLLTNYVKIAFRGLRERKRFGVINIVGLSVGLTCCLLIFLYISLQFQYDQFHPANDRLF